MTRFRSRSHAPGPTARWLARTITLAIMLSACSTSAPAASGEPGSDAATGQTTTMTVKVDGRERSFRLHVPAGLPLGGEVPLVVVVHGGLGSATQAEAAYGWSEVADREGLLVAYPDGIDRAWNAGGGCCGRSGREAVDDVDFIRQMVSTVDTEYPINSQRVYATGMSNGGMLAYRLACETNLFSAVGPVGATQLVACTSPQPASVMAIHGLADESVRFDGEPGSGVATIDGPPIPEVISGWRAVDACAAPVETVEGTVRRSSASCADGRAVMLITVAGAGHQWPGAVPASRVAMRALGLDPPSQALNATEELWAFFVAHPAPRSGS